MQAQTANKAKLCFANPSLFFCLFCNASLSFAFEDQTSILQADFSRTTCPNHIISPSKLFSNVLANFSSKAEEMTIIPTQVGLTIRSYFDVNATSNKVIKKGKLGTVQYELNEGVQTGKIEQSNQTLPTFW